jgi:AcrR family transcriptional regulator
MVQKRLKQAQAPDAAGDSDTRGDRTRILIKKTIAHLAMRKDVAAISLSDICGAANLTTGALYFHFKGKDEAIEEMVIDELQSRYADLTAPQPDERFETLVAKVLEILSQFHRKRKRLPRGIQVVINTRPKAYEAWLASRRPLIRRLEQSITQARAEKGLSSDAAPYLAHFILNSIEDLAMDVFQWKNPTLAPYARTAEDWNRRQTALWSWAILAPMEDI